MNTNTIYDAISGFDEKYISAADNTDAVSLSFRKHKNHKLKIVETLCACAALIITTGWISSQNWFEKKPFISQTTYAVMESITNAEQPKTEQTLYQETDSTTEKNTQTYSTGHSNQQEHTDNTLKADITSSPNSSALPVAPSVEHSSSVATTSVATTIVNNEEQPYIYKDVTVGYDTAKAYFGHPIVPCNRNDFTGYNVLLVIPNENNTEDKTDCISVTYLFESGSVDLRDQDKTGKVTPTGKKYEYCDRTFYVHTPEFNGDNIRIGYYPTGENGIAYQAHFNSRADMNEIMNLIISLELKN